MAERRYTLRTYFRYTSWPIILAMLALMVFGILAIHVYERSDPGVSGFATKQAVLGAIALLGFITATILPYQRLGNVFYNHGACNSGTAEHGVYFTSTKHLRCCIVIFRSYKANIHTLGL